MNTQVFQSIVEEDIHPHAPLIGSIDQGTSSTRFLLFTQKGRIAASAQIEHEQIYPTSNDGTNGGGWHEHDPLEIFENTKACIQALGDALKSHGIDLGQQDSGSSLVALGITNQRETTLAWNRRTGIPYYNAIVWDDTRTQEVALHLCQGDSNRLRGKTGLPISSYFAGTKVKWLLDNVEQLRKDLNDPAEQDNVCFGTIDSWLIYQLTGSSAGDHAANKNGLFCTDVTNASRWLFLDIHKMQWDQSLVDTVCYPHQVPLSCLPEVLPSSHIFGECNPGNGIPYLADVPIAGVLGDQQAALFGQTAFSPGEAKNTYGTGLFLMMNIGTKPSQSKNNGLLSTVAYQLGKDQPVHYALEGSVSHSGSTIQWLRDQLQIIPSARDSEALATSHNDGLYFVPAFAGLFAPHWRSDARACLVGLTTFHHKGHVCRAALEAAAYQTREIFDAIAKNNIGDLPELKSLKVDGGGTANKLLMQFQADMLQVPVIKPVIQETTALGVAFSAGLAMGVWKDLAEIKKLWAVRKTYYPQMSDEERSQNWYGWNKAVSRSFGWIETEEKPPQMPVATTTATHLVEAVGSRVSVSSDFEDDHDDSSDVDDDDEVNGKINGPVFDDLSSIVVKERMMTTSSSSTNSTSATSASSSSTSRQSSTYEEFQHSCKTILCSAAVGLAVGALIGSGGFRGRRV